MKTLFFLALVWAGFLFFTNTPKEDTEEDKKQPFSEEDDLPF